MAIESVTNNREINAFSGNDASVYIAQAQAVADLIASVSGDSSRCAERTIPEASMLIFTLLEAAQEAGAGESKALTGVKS